MIIVLKTEKIYKKLILNKLNNKYHFYLSSHLKCNIKGI